MTPEQDGSRDTLIDKLMSVRIRLRDVVFVTALLFFSVIFTGIFAAAIHLVASPYTTALQLSLWLRSSEYVAEYERDFSWKGYYQYDITLSTSHREITIHRTHRGGPIRIVAIEEIDVAKLGNIVPEPDLDPGERQMRAKMRRNLQTQLDALLATTRGTYNYLDDNQDPCQLADMRYIGIEYRIFRDAFSQHELMNSILDIDRALRYTHQRIDDVVEGMQGRT